MSAPRPMLANITQQAASEHNVHQQAEQQPGTKPQSASAPQEDLTYFQRQYHSALMSDSIRAHQEFLRQQEKQSPDAHAKAPQPEPSAEPAASATPVRQRDVGPTTQRSSGRRGGNKDRRSPVGASRSVAAHPYHADVDGYPCPCPDCNVRRLEEAMRESQCMAPHNDVAMQPEPHVAYDYYGQPISPLMGPGGAMQPGQGRHSPYQHSPYSPGAVGYSPNNGFYGAMPPSMPTSPLYAGAEAPSFDIPYIPPPQTDYTRFARSNDTPSDDEVGARGVSPVQRQQQGRPEHPRRQAPPRAPQRKEHVRLSPREANTAQEQQHPVVGKPQQQQQHQPEQQSPQQQAQRRSGKTSRRNSPLQSHEEPRPQQQTSQRRGSPSMQPSAARPPCPFALKVRCSPWHVRTVVSPQQFAAGDYVVFEGDRGKDAGRVVECAPSSTEVGGSGRQQPMLLTAADADDVARIESQEQDAATTVDTARALAERLRLSMQIVGAVYQHDRQKLTFMYEAGERVDFRQLLRELYSEFRCRIWMEIPPGSPNPAAATRSGNTGRQRQQ